ncbi:hypothetical protein GJ697_11810 [Pseudoduganella sp. FT25W]|uniref:Polymerase beta nucleotidyltransferase domain-containing protein n=2 Tax=Duganella alba TaxID=2666081 RepID=A0A6L5QFJ3_9BURK|nr:nucleotidyltransferase domain-containing protein [Duganella alba]MRX08524.1 hypothetical protein [Duganella alba]MRX17002.1 hypothetical protein [Duganella alba]
MDRQALVEALIRQLPGLLAVYVFGSRANGEARADSDLDLAGARRTARRYRTRTAGIWSTTSSLTKPLP